MVVYSYFNFRETRDEEPADRAGPTTAR
jgi:hypothetical protein